MGNNNPINTRERLVSAVTTVDRICSEAGASKGAFFHHFSSKQDVALQALKTWDEFCETLAISALYQNLGDLTTGCRHDSELAIPTCCACC